MTRPRSDVRRGLEPSFALDRDRTGALRRRVFCDVTSASCTFVFFSVTTPFALTSSLRLSIRSDSFATSANDPGPSCATGAHTSDSSDITMLLVIRGGDVISLGPDDSIPSSLGGVSRGSASSNGGGESDATVVVLTSPSVATCRSCDVTSV